MKFNQTNVERIRLAFENIGNNKWEAGDAALAEVPKAADGIHNDATTRVGALAGRAGVSSDQLRAYRDVAASWSPEDRFSDVAWSIHREVMGREDRISLITQILLEHGKVTVDLVRKFMGKAQTNTGKQETTSEQIETARVEEQAKAQIALAAALAEQERKAQAQAEQVRAEAERAKQAALAKAETEKQLAVQAVAAQAKVEAEAAAKVKLEKIEKQLRAEIKAEPPTDEVLAEMAKQAFNSNDPDIVAKMSEAYGKHRAERDAKAKSDANAQKAAARAQKAEDDAKRAAARASKEYEDSALFKFIDEVYPLAVELDRILSTKPITMSNMHASGFFEGQVRDMCDEVAEIAKRVEAQVLETMLEVEQTN